MHVVTSNFKSIKTKSNKTPILAQSSESDVSHSKNTQPLKPDHVTRSCDCRYIYRHQSNVLQLQTPRYQRPREGCNCSRGTVYCNTHFWASWPNVENWTRSSVDKPVTVSKQSVAIDKNFGEEWLWGKINAIHVNCKETIYSHHSRQSKPIEHTFTNLNYK